MVVFITSFPQKYCLSRASFSFFLLSLHTQRMEEMNQTINEILTGERLHTCPDLMAFIRQTGFLPLLACGIEGFSADELVDEECRYVVFPDGGWDWPMWKWKGPIVTDGGFAYGKFFAGKAGFITQEWWPDFCNYRRSLHPLPEEGTVEDAILAVLRDHGSMITRELRAACGFTGPKMRSRFDAYVTRLQAACRVVTEDFIYPRDRHGQEYGWGWALLALPEQLYGREACQCNRTPEASHDRIIQHLRTLLPATPEAQLQRLMAG